ncbi:RloB family protein [Methanococcoides seepicolus]|uniref:RloB domain-containing protein n=1 Tax=Methanococcoides seepicolus TaxID=2828780 RepID=A0A9E4ZBV4_9EURY|nr:RloB family protein [Methanococcoides seepicolus]MCM1985533.1 RloB domain-containing protein [Methanococcoides seepicolus]
MVRREGTRSITQMWIFCEGEKTEIHYFEHMRSDLRINKLKIKVKSSDDQDALSVIKYALDVLKHSRDYVPGDLIFCVFDRDENSSKELSQAKKLASAEDIQIIFSNPCFEFWILSHFERYERPLDNKLLKRKLVQFLGQYQKNDSQIYEKTKDRIDIAMKYSEEVVSLHESSGVDIISRDSNPSTLVHQLIEKIRTFVK